MSTIGLRVIKFIRARPRIRNGECRSPFASALETCLALPFRAVDDLVAWILGGLEQVIELGVILWGYTRCNRIQYQCDGAGVIGCGT